MTAVARCERTLSPRPGGSSGAERSVDVPTPVIPAYHDVYGYLEPESAQLATSSITLLAYPLTLGQRSAAAVDGVKQQVGYTDTLNEYPYRAEIVEQRVT